VGVTSRHLNFPSRGRRKGSLLRGETVVAPKGVKPNQNLPPLNLDGQVRTMWGEERDHIFANAKAAGLKVLKIKRNARSGLGVLLGRQGESSWHNQQMRTSPHACSRVAKNVGRTQIGGGTSKILSCPSKCNLSKTLEREI